MLEGKKNVLAKFCNGELQNEKIIQNLLCNNFYISSEMIFKFIKENKYKNLEYIIKYYILDNDFILKLLLLYQIKNSISQKELVKMISKEKNKINLDIKNEQGETPLTLACYGKNKSIINVLLDLGANVNKTNDKGLSPLAIVVRDKKKLIKKLIECGADVNIFDR